MDPERSCKNCSHAEVCILVNTIHEVLIQNAMFFDGDDFNKAGVEAIGGIGKYCKHHSGKE
jgi:hypothetical protein